MTKCFELCGIEITSCRESRIKCGCGVTFREYEAVTICLFRVLGVDIHLFKVKIRKKIRNRERAARMTGCRMVDSFECAKTNFQRLFGEHCNFCLFHEMFPPDFWFSVYFILEKTHYSNFIIPCKKNLVKSHFCISAIPSTTRMVITGHSMCDIEIFFQISSKKPTRIASVFYIHCYLTPKRRSPYVG